MNKRGSITNSLQGLTRLSLALFLLPCVWAAFKSLYLMVPAVGLAHWSLWWGYLGGALVYFLLERIFKKPMWLYILGHELTHALFGFLSGAKIYSFKANRRGGEVKLSKSNALIALSPYIVPGYTILVLFLYAALKPTWQGPLLSLAFQIGIGLTLAFHFSHTLYSLHRHQPDLKTMGGALSFVFISIGNALILGLLGVSLFKETPTLKTYMGEMASETKRVWIKSGQIVMQVLPPQK